MNLEEVKRGRSQDREGPSRAPLRKGSLSDGGESARRSASLAPVNATPSDGSRHNIQKNVK